MPELSRDEILKIQVSSVSRNDKNFGKQNLFDGREDTCWTSGEGCPQWISIEFKEAVCLTGFSLQFQGGFVGKSCVVELRNNEETQTEPFYPDDVNSVQKFTLSSSTKSKQLKLLFNESTDFFGRIVVYSVPLFQLRATPNVHIMKAWFSSSKKKISKEPGLTYYHSDKVFNLGIIKMCGLKN